MQDRRHSFGLASEYCTMLCYAMHGHKILAHRFKNPYGELDIVAVRGDHLIICEVKARAHSLHGEYIQYKQLERLKVGTEFFLMLNPRLQRHYIRFDLAVVSEDFLPKIICGII